MGPADRDRLPGPGEAPRFLVAQLSPFFSSSLLCFSLSLDTILAPLYSLFFN